MVKGRRIGIIVDGDSEFQALPRLLRRTEMGNNQVVYTLKAPIPPLASAGVIANSCKAGISILAAKNVADIIVLLDREDRQECSGKWAAEIVKKLRVPDACKGWVVIKDRMLENWLISDIDALKKFPRRYNIRAAEEKLISKENVDTLNAMRFLKDVTKPGYSKIQDSCKILEVADPLNMAVGSRSFRRLLRVVGNGVYLDQSKRSVSNKIS